MNKILLLGRCGSDPDIKEFNQNKVAKFSLATSESYKNKAGEKVTETQWHNLVFWGKQCNILAEHVHKGDQILVEGKIVTRQYKDKEGKDHWTTEIICSWFEFGSKKSEGKLDNKEGQWQKAGKTTAMSNINDLPGAAEDDSSYSPF